MDKKVVITIGREFGSGGHEVGEKLAKRLGISFYDKNILELVAQSSGIKEEFLEKEDERPVNPFFEPYTPYGVEGGSIGSRLFAMTRKIIKEKAEAESCVIVGRCSDIILEDMDDVYRIFIYAYMDDRIDRICERYQIEDRKEAKKLIKKTDKARRSYTYFYTDAEWGSRDDKELMINTSAVGVDGAVELIVQFLKVLGYAV